MHQSDRSLDAIGSLASWHGAADWDSLLPMHEIVHNDKRLNEHHQCHDGQHDGDQRVAVVGVEALDALFGEDVECLALCEARCNGCEGCQQVGAAQEAVHGVEGCLALGRPS